MICTPLLLPDAWVPLWSDTSCNSGPFVFFWRSQRRLLFILLQPATPSHGDTCCLRTLLPGVEIEILFWGYVKEMLLKGQRRWPADPLFLPRLLLAWMSLGWEGCSRCFCAEWGHSRVTFLCLFENTFFIFYCRTLVLQYFCPLYLINFAHCLLACFFLTRGYQIPLVLFLLSGWFWRVFLLSL